MEGDSRYASAADLMYTQASSLDGSSQQYLDGRDAFTSASHSPHQFSHGRHVSWSSDTSQHHTDPSQYLQHHVAVASDHTSLQLNHIQPQQASIPVQEGVLTRRRAAMARNAGVLSENQQQSPQVFHQAHQITANVSPLALPYLNGAAFPSPDSRPTTPSGSSTIHAGIHQRFGPLHSPAESRSLHQLPSHNISPSGHPTTPTTATSSQASSHIHSGRSMSPANSIASTHQTSLSGGGANDSLTPAACSPPHYDDVMTEKPALNLPPMPTQGRKKQRLFNIDRKSICYYAKGNPTARQEDIAARYGVERSTISKILKNKSKWMALPEGEEMRIAKHRPSKFPEIEAKLAVWVKICVRDKIILTDGLIRQKAREAANELGIGEDKFKASSGWVENFKHRHNIRRGTQMFGREEMDMAAMPQDPPPTVPADVQEIYRLRNETAAPAASSTGETILEEPAVINGLGDMSAPTSTTTMPPPPARMHPRMGRSLSMSGLPIPSTTPSSPFRFPHQVPPMITTPSMPPMPSFTPRPPEPPTTRDLVLSTGPEPSDAFMSMDDVLKYIDAQPAGFVTPEERQLLADIRVRIGLEWQKKAEAAAS